MDYALLKKTIYTVLNDEYGFDLSDKVDFFNSVLDFCYKNDINVIDDLCEYIYDNSYDVILDTYVNFGGSDKDFLKDDSLVYNELFSIIENNLKDFIVDFFNVVRKEFNDYDREEIIRNFKELAIEELEFLSNFIYGNNEDLYGENI